MSLTSLLSVREVKARFQKEFSKPITRGRPVPKVPPRTGRYSLVGTAFDYLARMYLKRRYPRAKVRKWVACETLELLRRAANPKNSGDEALQVIGPAVSVSIGAEDIVEELFGASEDFEKLKQLVLAERGASREIPFYPFLFRERRLHRLVERAYIEEVGRVVDEARETYSSYLSGGRLKVGDICRQCLRLAQVDPLYRAGKFDVWLGATDEEDIADLCSLLKLFSSRSWLHKKRVVLLNPTFGDASLLVGGADADLVLDDMLVDIKCTKHRALRGDMFHHWWATTCCRGWRALTARPRTIKSERWRCTLPGTVNWCESR